MDQVLGQVLRNAVWERLDLLADLASKADDASLHSIARSELPRLAEGWRAMLSQHLPNAQGLCPTCSTSRWNRIKGPCSVWKVAHEHLVAGGLASHHIHRSSRRSQPVVNVAAGHRVTRAVPSLNS